MKKSNRAYTDEFKKDAISLALRSPTVKSAANSLGIPVGTLTTWLKSIGGKKYSSPDTEIIDVSEELKKLRKENARLREEREILKKAATFFVKESK